MKDVEEVVSDAFVALWRAIETGRYDGSVGIKYYLYGIARKTALNRKRELSKRQSTEAIDEVIKIADLNVEQEAVRKVDYQILNEVIMELKSPDKEEVGDEMDEGEKERLLKNILNKVENEKKHMDTSELYGRKKWRIQKRVSKAAAAAAIIFITGNAVVIGATMLHLNNKFLSYFAQEETKDTEIGNNLRAVETKAVDRGVTVEVEQVLGDDHGFYALFNVKGVKKEDYMLEPCFRDYEVTILGLKEDVPIGYNVVKVYDDKEDEFSFMLKVNSQNLTGKKIKFTLKDFGEGRDDEFQSRVNGVWNLDWKLSYINNAKRIDVDKEIDLYGGKYNWDSISISPLSVSVSTTMLQQGSVHQSDDLNVDLNDEFYVDFADGTRLNKEYMDTDDIYIDGSDVSMSFHSIKKYEDIVSVTYAGVTVPVNPTKQEKREVYVNEQMKFSLQMSKELNNMVMVSDVTSYEDEYLNTSGQYVSFVGEKDGAKMTLFSIYRLKGMISEQELEENAPLKIYLTYKDGYTYLIEYGEIVSEEQMVFVDILNREVAGIKHFLDCY